MQLMLMKIVGTLVAGHSLPTRKISGLNPIKILMITGMKPGPPVELTIVYYAIASQAFIGYFLFGQKSRQPQPDQKHKVQLI